jgi:LPXTG-motif cell wall-anchored protein
LIRSTRTTRLLSLGVAAALALGGSALTAAPAFAEPQPLPLGTVTIEGTPKLGETLTAATAGWPADTEFEYEWYYSGGQFGGEITGEVESTYVVDADIIGLWIGVIVTASNPYYSGTQTVNVSLDVTAFAPQLPTAAAPVADSTGLAAFLASKDVIVEAPEFAGLAASLPQGSDQTADLPWWGGDSFVDVYLYSTPIVVGTVAVVDGVAQITLTSAVLAEAGAGAHTLVAVGQTSGSVQAFALQVGPALAATGSTVDASLIAVAGILLLGGIAFVIVTRRRQAA